MTRRFGLIDLPGWAGATPAEDSGWGIGLGGSTPNDRGRSRPHCDPTGRPFRHRTIPELVEIFPVGCVAKVKSGVKSAAKPCCRRVFTVHGAMERRFNAC